jgi:hypothetical protein
MVLIHSIMKREPYSCIRCGYVTHHKACMRRHFSDLKKPCPSIAHDIELTDHIKQCILDNRVYHIPARPTTHATSTHHDASVKVVNQTINQYNTMNNFIAGMGALDKLNTLMSYTKTSLIDFNDSIEHKYARKVKKLDANGFPHTFQLDQQQLLEIFDDVSRACNAKSLRDFNILYDTRFNRLQLFECGGWDTLLIDSGLKRLLESLQTYYLNSYELYLIRKASSTTEVSARERQDIMTLIADYYRFIASFNVEPCVKYKDDQELYDAHQGSGGCSSYSIADKFMELFCKARDQSTRSEIEHNKKKVIDILRSNTQRNIEDLNKCLLNLINMDEDFKTQMISTLPVSIMPSSTSSTPSKNSTLC